MQVSHSVCTRCVGLIRVLLTGADVTITSRHGYTALHYAARRGNLGIVQTLLEHNASVDAQDCGQLTPLMVAMRTLCLGANSNDQDTRQRIVEALIVPSTSINAVDIKGCTALGIATGTIIKGSEKDTPIIAASLCIRVIEAGQN